MNRIHALIAASAEKWRLSLRVATFIFWFPLIGSIIVALTRLDKDVYRLLLHEDGPVEWGQFAFYLVACVAALLVTWQCWRAGDRIGALLYAGVVVATFFVAGEEIAWGQRILHLHTPTELAAINAQDEITVHNIGHIQDAFNVMMMIAGGYGTFANLLNWEVLIGQYWEAAEFLIVPPFFLSSTFFVVFGYKVIRFTVWIESGFTISKYAEWVELCFAFGLAAFALLNVRRLTSPRRLTIDKQYQQVSQEKHTHV